MHRHVSSILLEQLVVVGLVFTNFYANLIQLLPIQGSDESKGSQDKCGGLSEDSWERKKEKTSSDAQVK